MTNQTHDDTNDFIKAEPHETYEGLKKQFFALKSITEELHEHEQSFQLRWDADMRAIKMWHDAGGDEMVWPDHCKLVIWLLEQITALKKHRDALQETTNKYLFRARDAEYALSDAMKAIHELHNVFVLCNSEYNRERMPGLFSRIDDLIKIKKKYALTSKGQ